MYDVAIELYTKGNYNSMDVAHIFLHWLVYKFCVSDMWKQIFCASQILVWCDQNFATLPEGKFW